MEQHDKKPLKDTVMSAIARGSVSMRPRSHFIVLSLLAAAFAAVTMLLLAFLMSLAFFLLRESGAWFATPFGSRGWFIFLHATPIIPLLLIVIFTIILYLLVRRYPVGYRMPLTFSVGAIVASMVIGGFVLSMTPLHFLLARHARHGDLPTPVGMWYGGFFRPGRSEGVYRGVVDSYKGNTLTITDPDGDGTWPIVITPKTRLPYGEEFEPGDMVLVIGDTNASGTIEAFGIRAVEDTR